MKEMVRQVAVVVGSLIIMLPLYGASVKWSSGTSLNGFKDHENVAISSEMGYEMIVTFYFDQSGASKIADSAASTPNLANAFVSTASGDDEAAISYFDNKATYYVKAIIKNSEWCRSTEILEFTMPDTGNGDLNFTIGTGFAVAGNKWGEWKSVPEPTSGLLMLLGLTALVLKRKRV